MAEASDDFAFYKKQATEMFLDKQSKLSTDRFHIRYNPEYINDFIEENDGLLGTAFEEDETVEFAADVLMSSYIEDVILHGIELSFRGFVERKGDEEETLDEIEKTLHDNALATIELVRSIIDEELER